MITIERKVHIRNEGGRHRVRRRRAKRDTVPEGRIPRVSKLMALAIHLDGLVRDGVVRSYSELAHLAHVSQPRVTQIMGLLHLAPDIQEDVLHLPRVVEGRDPVSERSLRPLVVELDWEIQRSMWDAISQT